MNCDDYIDFEWATYAKWCINHYIKYEKYDNIGDCAVSGKLDDKIVVQELRTEALVGAFCTHGKDNNGQCLADPCLSQQEAADLAVTDPPKLVTATICPLVNPKLY